MKHVVQELNAYRLTIIGAVVALSLSAAAILILGADRAEAYIILVSPTIVGLMALLKIEQNSKRTEVLHEENKEELKQIKAETELNMSKTDAAELTRKIVAEVRNGNGGPSHR